VRSLSVVMPGIPGEDRPQVPFTKDQHLVGDLGPGGEYEPFGIGRGPVSAARTAWSARSSPGRGLTRRSTATSWRSTSSSAVLEAGERLSSISHRRSG
jgi:hypothetical protein